MNSLKGVKCRWGKQRFRLVTSACTRLSPGLGVCAIRVNSRVIEPGPVSPCGEGANHHTPAQHALYYTLYKSGTCFSFVNHNYPARLHFTAGCTCLMWQINILDLDWCRTNFIDIHPDHFYTSLCMCVETSNPLRHIIPWDRLNIIKLKYKHRLYNDVMSSVLSE